MLRKSLYCYCVTVRAGRHGKRCGTRTHAGVEEVAARVLEDLFVPIVYAKDVAQMICGVREARGQRAVGGMLKEKFAHSPSWLSAASVC